LPAVFADFGALPYSAAGSVNSSTGFTFDPTVAGTGNPPQPSWPPEWTTTVTKENLTTNETMSFQMSWSTSYNCTLNELSNQDGGWMNLYNLFSAHLTYTVIGGPTVPQPVCSQAPLAGALDPPPVSEFAYQGSQEFPPGSGRFVWLWRGGNLIFGTQQTAEQLPALLLDGDAHVVYAFSNVQLFAPNSWPHTFFTPPSQCAA